VASRNDNPQSYAQREKNLLRFHAIGPDSKAVKPDFLWKLRWHRAFFWRESAIGVTFKSAKPQNRMIPSHSAAVESVLQYRPWETSFACSACGFVKLALLWHRFEQERNEEPHPNLVVRSRYRRPPPQNLRGHLMRKTEKSKVFLMFCGYDL